MGKSAKKKRSAARGTASEPQVKRSKTTESTTVEISEDTLGIVMEYLGPMELFSMARTCKALHGKVTTKMVVRSAVMHGGGPKSTVEELYRLLTHDTIYTPSPWRLLRLVAGKRCEVCNENKVKHANQGLGTFLCFRCLNRGADKFLAGVTKREARKARGYNRMTILDDRVTGRWGDRREGHCRETSFFNVLLCRRLIQNSEPCGPRFTFVEFQRIAEGTEPVDAMLDEILPPQDNSEFLQAYDASEEEAAAAVEYRKAKKKEASQKAAEKRLSSSIKILSTIQGLLEVPWKGYALTYEETHGYDRKSPCLEFQSPLCNELLKAYMISPSKAKKCAIAGVANTINTFCKNISENGMLGLEFLSEDDPFEQVLKQACQEGLSDMKSFLFHPFANSRLVSILEEGDPFAALAYLLQGDFVIVLPLPPPAPEGTIHLLDSISDRCDAAATWNAAEKEHQGEACQRKRASKTFATLSEWQGFLAEYFDYLKIHGEKVGLPVSSVTRLWSVLASTKQRELLLAKNFKGLLYDCHAGLLGINED